ncbi:hypothetical protein P171DRAFT_521203 [Karstenula rhodostoma CBS 690.94]|uniref:Uncharacterized protein n=1 Tax=Karstenula rhodostoma CBS 690.94 TaxID=1392251 RepID=A0A9P4UDH0_9PLEO|nr:hypothetical protein P171DRAFT_521203 [Karstenula rhodostoma CBS 690.94]
MRDYRKMFPPQDRSPPQYVDTSTPLIPPRNSDKRTPVEQLRRYIIEIMGFTFDTDFTLLNEALGQTALCTCPTKSILTPEERAKLLSLATLIKEVKPKMTSGNAWLTVRYAEREAIAEAVVRPAHYVGLTVGYVLEIISTYAVHQCDPSKRALSFISQKKPYFYTFWKCLAFLGPLNIVLGLYSNDLWAHAHVIGVTVPCEEVRAVLGNAMQTYQKEVLGIKQVWQIKKVFSGESWTALAGALISEDEEDVIRSGRWSRERKEAKENAKAVAKVEAELR